MASTTTGLTNLMQIFYDRKFLERAKANLILDWGAQKKPVPANSGKTVYFNRFRPLAKATTALTEAVNPADVDMTTDIVSATVAEYGNWVKVSSLFKLTSLDEGLSEHSSVMGQNAGETIDTLIAAQLSAGATAQLAGSKTSLSTVAITDVFSGAEIRKAVRTLKKNKAYKFSDGLFHGFVQPYTSYDLFGNTEWLNSIIYTDTKQLKEGIVGKLHGVLFKESSNLTEEEDAGASSADIQHNYIFGEHSYGVVDISTGSKPKMIVKTPGPQDTSNPLNMFSSVGWKVEAFAVKVLNADWIINVKSGATDKT